ncbi:RHS repeat-associated core domain-containing protein [Paenarthrobacter sp. GOM3]|uniref:RHS repeat domain-containing protein n=1 Tax=Paenarthrobacter sp. GOM3 TaxID=2782567 RepID=UPI001BA97959|nr:RHS repeat-associated core domain-containing protein [Paenarthrobacter sp. GOM3]WOH19126.1 RHS repeat-associated core domain-containing protein [Paenarthrobacter sp. GOM3]
MNVTAINPASGTGTGWFRVYPSDEPEPPLSSVNYSGPGDAVSNVVIVRPGTTDGKINVKNMGGTPAHFVIDTQGWFTNAHLLPPATGPDGTVSGQRGAASMVNHTLSDTASVGWNPTTGNTVLTGSLLHLRGIGQDLNLGWRYNSYNDARPTLSMGRLEAALRVNSTTNAVTYTAPDGGWYTFASTGTNTWAMPPGLNASLSKPNPNEYRIRFNDTGVTNVYTDDGANYSLARTIDANLTTPNTITYGHLNGVLDTITDTQGRTLKFLYQDTRNLNQPSKVTDTSLNRSVTFEYNGGQGRLSKITDAAGTTTAFTYNTSGKLSSYTDGKTVKTSFTYDTAKRTATITYGTGTTAQSVWTPAYPSSTTTTLKDPNGKTATYTYNAQNRATGKTIGGAATTVTYDGASNILTFVDPTGTVTYKYDAANRLASLAEPGGSCPATPAFPNSAKCTGFGYDKNNRRISTSYPNGVTNTTAYNNAGKIMSITAKNSSGTVLTKREYTYTTSDTTGKDGALRETMATEVAGSLTTYGYDVQSRLTSATQGTTVEGWTYDKNSNRMNATKTGTPTVYSTYNAADQLCWTATTNGACGSAPAGATTYTYDANGNTTAAGTTTNAFNVFNQVTSTTVAGATTNFAYAGLRNDERTSAGSTNFLNGSLGITTQTIAGATTAFIRDPDGGLVSMRISTGASLYYTTDALGSVILLTDSTQAKAATYSYDSWGNTTAAGTQAAANPWQYAGGYKDTPTGYTKFGARYYNPTTGRFTQPDPSDQEQNRYLYAGANPVNNSDPSGLYSVGEGAQDCAMGAATNAAIGVGIGAVTGGGGLVAALGLGCITNVAAGYLADSLTDNQQAEDQVGGGINYLQWLTDVARVIGAF